MFMYLTCFNMSHSYEFVTLAPVQNNTPYYYKMYRVKVEHKPNLNLCRHNYIRNSQYFFVFRREHTPKVPKNFNNCVDDILSQQQEAFWTNTFHFKSYTPRAERQLMSSDKYPEEPTARCTQLPIGVILQVLRPYTNCYSVHLDRPKPLVVFDPFCGTGSTGQAARLLGCNFYGSDIDR